MVRGSSHLLDLTFLGTTERGPNDADLAIEVVVLRHEVTRPRQQVAAPVPRSRSLPASAG